MKFWKKKKDKKSHQNSRAVFVLSVYATGVMVRTYLYWLFRYYVPVMTLLAAILQ